MKKFTFFTIIVLLLALIMVSINIEEIINIFIEKQEQQEEIINEDSIKNYFPIRQNIKYVYEASSDDLLYEVTPDYTSEGMIQLRITGNEGVTVSVIKVNDKKATGRIMMQENLLRENLLNSAKLHNQDDMEDVLLMEPLATGTEWTVSGNHQRKITNTDSIVETDIGTYDAIEVTTESVNYKKVDYYTKGIGLIKSVITSEDKTTTIVITEIIENFSFTENIEFYYPDFNKMKILYKVQNVEFKTNDLTETVIAEAYKKALPKENSVLTKETGINRIFWDAGGTLCIDLNKAFIDNAKEKAIHEGMVLQSIANTFGRFFNTEQVYFTVDDENYASDHIDLSQGTFAVNFIGYPLFYDIVIYGGTPSGITAAVSAAREGMDVALIEQGSHIGGMVTGGLGFTDRGNTKIIGGITREVFEKIGRHYGKDAGWDFEPHVAENVLLEIIEKEEIDLYYNKKIKEDNGIEKDGKKIISIETDDGDLFFAQVFIDSSYEGDLMAMSNVSYTTGREDSKKYNESFAGLLPPMGTNNFYYNLNAHDEDGSLYSGILNEYPGAINRGDKKIQAYNYRLCVTNQPENRIPFYKPNNYNEENYKLLAAWLNKIKEIENRNLAFSDVVYLGRLPNNKYDVNNYGPFSTDLIGGSWEYPDADYERREEIKNEHKEYIQGLLYFISTDSSVPAELREDVKQWGYAADEFEDNHYWPYQIYVREGRRMLGDYVLTESDIRKEKTKYDSVGMGSYSIDTHNVQRFLTKDGFVLNEGELQYPVTPYEIPYRVMIPKAAEADNLIVSVCISASHIAYSSVRMEPQYMIMGEAAGLAAKISIDDNTNVQNINYNKLKAKLTENVAVLRFE